MNGIQGNPYSQIKEVFRHQGPLSHTVNSAITTGVHTLKNADALQFYITGLNVDFDVAMQFCTSSGETLRDAAGVVVPNVVIMAASTVTFAQGRRAFNVTYPATNVNTEPREAALPKYADFVKFIINYKADTAYTPPAPVSTGVPNLHNSAMSIKDENAPLLEVKVKLINPKP